MADFGDAANDFPPLGGSNEAEGTEGGWASQGRAEDDVQALAGQLSEVTIAGQGNVGGGTWASVAAASEGTEGGGGGAFGGGASEGLSGQPEESFQTTDGEAEEGVIPTEGQLQNIFEACAQLWELDVNRLIPGEHYEINLQEGKNLREHDDVAAEPLFSFVNEDVFSRPTYSRFYSLLDNYNPEAAEEEEESRGERGEEVEFVEEICKTPVMKYLFNYLQAKQLINEDWATFKSSLCRLWFKKYGRGGGHKSSSAFEHVFVGEVKVKRRGEQGGDWIP